MKKSLCALFLLLTLVSACGKKTSLPPSVPPEQTEQLADLKSFPQDLLVYAKETGLNKVLLSASRQESMTARFLDIYFGPWQMAKTSIKRREVTSLFAHARGYKNAAATWSQSEWDSWKANADLGRYPSRAAYAITLRSTNLRELPTHAMRFDKPTADPKVYPFDYFQYSALAPGMPLLIAHTSADGRWHYVECPIAGGWVDAADVALTTPEFRHAWRTGLYAALIRDNVTLPGTGANGKDSKAGIGALLPVTGQKNGIQALVPIRAADGTAKTAEITLSGKDAALLPLPLTPANVAKVGNVMMAQPYGWGGMLNLRDCSSMLRDLFTPFGIWLPRNSVAQARRGQVIRLDGLTTAQKETAILRDGVPFLSLVGMKGHITLYVGRWKNRPAIFHDAWGLRIVKDGNDDERFVIGKVVVTSIAPGMELENLYRPRTFADRLRTLTRLAHDS